MTASLEMAGASSLPVPVRKYLQDLELALKARPVVSIEDSLSDAREHLVREWEAIHRADGAMGAGEIYSHFCETFGAPEMVAEERRIPGAVSKKVGHAPGWRLCCRSCGRSVPADHFPMVRVGARSTYKLLLTYCRGCKGYRWVRLIRDLEVANITDSLGLQNDPEEARALLHRVPRLSRRMVVIGIEVMLALMLAGGLWMAAVMGQEPRGGVNDLFPNMPEGWKVVKQSSVPRGQLGTFESKFQVKLDALINTVVEYQGASVQINLLRCKTEEDAERAKGAFIGIKKGGAWVRKREKTVYEWVVKNSAEAKLALRSKYALEIQPKRCVYQVRFEATPLSRSNDREWNTQFNRLLKGNQGSEADIEVARKGFGEFEIGKELWLSRYGMGGGEAKWKRVIAESQGEMGRDGEVRYRLADRHATLGIAYAQVEGEVVCESGGSSPSQVADPKRWLVGTEAWPVESRAIGAIAGTLGVAGKEPRERVEAVLEWCGSQQGLKYGGAMLGSRYGVEAVLTRKEGRCWDFSDVCVTLCRHLKVPARQVFGWMDGSEGHVWVEVWLDGRWHAVDPTTGLGCGSDYVPIAVSDEGKTPLLYLTQVSLELLEAK